MHIYVYDIHWRFVVISYEYLNSLEIRVDTRWSGLIAGFAPGHLWVEFVVGSPP